MSSMKKKSTPLRPQIILSGEINEELFLSFCSQLREVEEIGANSCVELILHSSGGFAETAFAFLSRMETSPMKFHTKVMGAAHSAAVLILAASNSREMDPNASIMIHEEEVHFEQVPLSIAKRDLEREIRIDAKWNHLMAVFTRRDAAFWAQLSKDVTYLTAEEAKEYGLIDFISEGIAQ